MEVDMDLNKLREATMLSDKIKSLESRISDVKVFTPDVKFGTSGFSLYHVDDRILADTIRNLFLPDLEEKLREAKQKFEEL